MRIADSAVLAAVLALVGCNAISSPGSAPDDGAAAPSAAEPGAPATKTASMPAFLEGLDCDAAGLTCIAPGFTISGSVDVCAKDSTSFGAISDTVPVEARGRLHGTDVVASLAPGQFVCIHYTAQPTAPDAEPWLYVTGISSRQVPACKTARCGNPDARSHWSDGRAGTCEVRGAKYSAGCPAGWVPGTSVEAYSMGL